MGGSTPYSSAIARLNMYFNHCVPEFWPVTKNPWKSRCFNSAKFVSSRLRQWRAKRRSAAVLAMAGPDRPIRTGTTDVITGIASA